MTFALCVGMAAALYHKDHVDAFLGPGCTYALDPVARMAAFWNIPVVTGQFTGLLEFYIVE